MGDEDCESEPQPGAHRMACTLSMRHKLGLGICALDAGFLLGSLFMPWYGPDRRSGYFTFFGGPPEALDFFSGRWNPDGWQVLSVIDIYLTALAAVAPF